jgi:hypothetical protein
LDTNFNRRIFEATLVAIIGKDVLSCLRVVQNVEKRLRSGVTSRADCSAHVLVAADLFADLCPQVYSVSPDQLCIADVVND